MVKQENRSRRRISSLAGIGLAAAILAILTLVIAEQISQPVMVDWEPDLHGPTGIIVTALTLDPDNPGILYAGTDGGGVYKSKDGGQSWEQKNEGLESVQGTTKGMESARQIRDILISRLQPGVIYAATWGPEGLYRSDDGGETWFPQMLDVLGTGDPHDETILSDSVHVRALAETDTDILAGTRGGVFRLVEPDEGFWQPTPLKGQDKSIYALVVDPRDPRVVYAGTEHGGVYKSEDGGASWQPSNEGLDSEAALWINALAIDPADSAVVFAGTFGDGVYRSVDAGQEWAPWREGLPQDAQVWSLAFAGDGRLLAGLRYEGTYERAGNEGWRASALRNGAFALEVDPGTGEVYAGTWGSGVYCDREGDGHSWLAIGPTEEYLRLRTTLYVHSTLYAGTANDGIYASQDNGQTWERLNEGLTGEALDIRALTLGPDGLTLYAGTQAGVFASKDEGREWTLVGERPEKQRLSVTSLAVVRNDRGTDDVYAGTRAGLWHWDGAQQQWNGPQAFRYRGGIETELFVPSLLVIDDIVCASVWGSGVYRPTPQGPWEPVEMAPKYVAALTQGERVWLRCCGRQVYALTERGLYGSRDGKQWGPLDYGQFEALVADPVHPYVAYASIVPITTTTSITSTAPTSGTLTLVSKNDGRKWEDAGRVDQRVIGLESTSQGEKWLFALVADGGLYRGRVTIPWLGREVAAWGLLLALCLGAVLAIRGYLRLHRICGSHLLVLGLLSRPWLLLKVSSRRFQNRLQPTNRIILATMTQPEFRLADVWEKLDEIGVSISEPRLTTALSDLVETGLIGTRDGTWHYRVPGLAMVAAFEFQESDAALIEGVRRDNRLLDDIKDFFKEARFYIRQDASQRLTKFILRSRQALYREQDQYHAWLRSSGPLNGEEVDAICANTIEAGKAQADRVPVPAPTAFAIVTELPEVDAFRQIWTWRSQVRLVLLSVTTIRSALRERSASRDLDRLVQQQPGQTALYDIRGPALDRLDFFGRHDIVESIRAALLEGRTVDLWSLPGAGKTSLLWHLKETLDTPAAAYVDLTYGWPGESLFYEQVIDSLDHDLWFKYRRFLEDAKDDFGQQLMAFVRAVPGGDRSRPRVVLLIDGFSLGAEGSEQRSVLDQIRRLAGDHTDLALVVAWQSPLPHGKADDLLGVLNKEDSNQLITAIGAQIGLQVAPDALAQIYRETGGHPLLLRKLGGLISRQVLPRHPPEFAQIVLADVERVLSGYAKIRAHHFETVRQQFSPDQKSILEMWSSSATADWEGLSEDYPHLKAWTGQNQVLGELFAQWVQRDREESLV
jgi:photosystem II stability/assembly factor-like uncharacterized protein